MTPAQFLEKLLTIRGIITESDREKFLHPKYDDLYDPFLMYDMEKSVDRILLAVQNNERICVYSDYDVDGIPGGVILHDFFHQIGYKNFCNYIPHRHDEGYGVHIGALEQLASDGVRLVITVDVGITAVPEVLHGNSLGLDIIITDHHEPLEILPQAFAIVNPKLGTYPDRMLCGSGVAFKLVQALDKKLIAHQDREDSLLKPYGLNLKPGFEKWLLDMAGMATLSDMVPLVNENRIIAFYGMKVLQKNRRPGLRALLEKSGINVNYLTETDIVFSITPKLNAAGRMAHPMDAFNTLAAMDARTATIAAEHLSGLNDERKKIVARIMRDVHKKLLARKTSNELREVIVIGDPSWPAGILGLIASKVIEEYKITTFVWGAEGESIKGSARGIGDVPIVQLMQSVSHLLVQFGGHDDAGGFSATRETIHFLEDEFCKKYPEVRKHKSQDGDEESQQNYDFELGIADVTIENYRAMRQMAPFGMANPNPVFAFKNVMVESVQQFGKTKEHLEVVILSDDRKLRAISWYATPDSFSEKIEQGKTITLLGEFDFSVFRGKSELRLKIIDII